MIEGGTPPTPFRGFVSRGSTRYGAAVMPCFHRFLFALLPLVAPSSLLGAKPTLWIIGDSTVRNGTPGQQGWGDPLAAEFDSARITVHNRAIGGRSSRSFLTEGRWEAILAHLKRGDFVLMQFGHNDGGRMFEGDRPRASIKGSGEESRTGVVAATGKKETVHSYGWYLRKYASDAKAKGATPIVLSQIPRNIWKDGRITRNDQDYALWAKEAAEQVDAPFIDLNGLLADALEELGREKAAKFFGESDHTHTNPHGAAFNARILAGAVCDLADCTLGDYLLPAEVWLRSGPFRTDP